MPALWAHQPGYHLSLRLRIRLRETCRGLWGAEDWQTLKREVAAS